MSDIKFPVDVQMDGKLYTVTSIIYPKQVGSPLAVARMQGGILGKRKVQSPSTRIRLARRVLELDRQ